MKRSTWTRITLMILFILLMLMLTSCVPGDGKASTDDPAGFFWGIWHGWLAPLSLVIGLFNRDIRIYEFYNTGWWYDLGYYMAILGGFGGLSFVRKRKRRDRTFES